MRLYHATSIENVASIKEQGLKAFWEGVYLTDSIDSALRWIGFRLTAMGKSEIAVIEVEVDGSKLEEGTDHSPFMVQFFGVGKSLLSQKSIPKSRVKRVHYYKIGGNEQ
jgi:hypothetical protein